MPCPHISCISTSFQSVSRSVSSFISPWDINTELLHSLLSWLLAQSQVRSCPVQLNDTHLSHTWPSSSSLQSPRLLSRPYMGGIHIRGTRKVTLTETGREHVVMTDVTKRLIFTQTFCVNPATLTSHTHLSKCMLYWSIQRSMINQLLDTFSVTTSATCQIRQLTTFPHYFHRN